MSTEGIRIAQAFSIFGSAFIAGSALSTSLIAAPALLAESPHYSPTHAAIQWKAMWWRGARIMPPFTLLASSAYFYLAFQFHSFNSQLYAMAGTLTFGMIPYTFLVMMNTNISLINAADAEEKPEAQVEGGKRHPGGNVKNLLESWTSMNLIRGLFPLAGTVVGLFATFSV